MKLLGRQSGSQPAQNVVVRPPVGQQDHVPDGVVDTAELKLQT